MAPPLSNFAAARGARQAGLVRFAPSDCDPPALARAIDRDRSDQSDRDRSLAAATAVAATAAATAASPHPSAGRAGRATRPTGAPPTRSRLGARATGPASQSRSSPSVLGDVTPATERLKVAGVEACAAVAQRDDVVGHRGAAALATLHAARVLGVQLAVHALAAPRVPAQPVGRDRGPGPVVAAGGGGAPGLVLFPPTRTTDPGPRHSAAVRSRAGMRRDRRHVSLVAACQMPTRVRLHKWHDASAPLGARLGRER